MSTSRISSRIKLVHGNGPGQQSSWRRGFTLLEMLVVVAMIGILAATVVVNFIGADREQNLKTEAQRLALTLEMARDEALQRNRSWGLFTAANGYGFVSYDADLKRWQPIKEKPFGHRELPHSMILNAQHLGTTAEANRSRHDEEHHTPDIIVFSDGEITPFELTLTPSWNSRPWIISTDGLARTEAKRI